MLQLYLAQGLLSWDILHIPQEGVLELKTLKKTFFGTSTKLAFVPK